MQKISMKVFLDTNVWIDFVLERMPFYMASATLLSIAERRNLQLCISSLTAINTNYVCHEREKMPVGMVKYKLESLRDIVMICSVNGDDIYNSYNSDWKDFEDGVQNYAAERWGADCIVTRNPKDFSLSSIKVYTPDEFIQKFSV